MRIGIIDSNYSKREHRGLAATWLQWELERAGVKECPPEVADVLLCTVSAPEGVPGLRTQLKKYWNGRSRVILGGGGAWSPAVFEKVVDLICVGEGQNFMRTLLTEGLEAAESLPEVWRRGEEKLVIPSQSFPWDCPPLNHPDGTVRVWGSRGCKKKCLFCQTGWQQKYLPNPNPARVQRQIFDLEKRNRRIAVITNDGAADNFEFSGQQQFVSASYSALKKMNMDRKIMKSIRVGVEGVSERLRRAVRKRVDNQGLVELCKRAADAGVGVRLFYVVGLPGETDADWAEFQGLIDMIKVTLDKGVIMMNLHGFIPGPAHNLGVLPLKDEYWERFSRFKDWFFGGPGFTKHVQIVAPAMYKTRLKNSCKAMCATPEQLRKGWLKDDNPNWRVQYLLTPAQLRAKALKYADEVGLKI